jgi:hypothetical protein
MIIILKKYNKMKLTCIYLLILALIMSLEIKCSSSLLKNKQRMKNKAKAHLKSKVINNYNSRRKTSRLQKHNK